MSARLICLKYRCWQASGRLGLWFRSIGSYSSNRLTTSPHSARTTLPRSASPSQVALGHSIGPVSAVPIQHATDAATPAPPLLGVLPPEAPRRVSTPAALPETPSPAEIEFMESVGRYSHADWAREQHGEPVCDAAVRDSFLRSPSVFPDDFLLQLALRQTPPVVGSTPVSR